MLILNKMMFERIQISDALSSKQPTVRGFRYR